VPAVFVWDLLDGGRRCPVIEQPVSLKYRIIPALLIKLSAKNAADVTRRPGIVIAKQWGGKHWQRKHEPLMQMELAIKTETSAMPSESKQVSWPQSKGPRCGTRAPDAGLGEF